MKHPKTITLKMTKEIDFSWHLDGKDLVIDKCEGISVEDGLSMFPGWAWESLMRGKA